MSPRTEKSQNGTKKHSHNPITDGVKWVEKYTGDLEKVVVKFPDTISKYIACLAIITFGGTLKGEWVVVLAGAMKHYSKSEELENQVINGTTEGRLSLENLKMTGFWTFFFVTHIVSYFSYFALSGFYHWYFYIKRRDKPEEWKCQPNKWLSAELELDSIKLGTSSLFITGCFSAFLACYLHNGNPSTMYFGFSEYGWPWFFAQFVVLFFYLDYITYIMHRFYHTPWLYINFHKRHHKYKQPTAFSAMAIHPVEMLHLQFCLFSPLFLFPVHWLAFYVNIIYNFYHGFVVHSGVNFKAHWWQPWQPDAKFHDLHHEFFHINFGFNLTLWDRIHGTLRKQDRQYTEETFFGEAPLIEDANKTQEITNEETQK